MAGNGIREYALLRFVITEDRGDHADRFAKVNDAVDVLQDFGGRLTGECNATHSLANFAHNRSFFITMYRDVDNRNRSNPIPHTQGSIPIVSHLSIYSFMQC